MDPSTPLPSGTQITVQVSFDTTGNMGEMVLDPQELATYINGQVPLSEGSVSLSTPLFNYHEGMTISGVLQQDTSVGELTGWIQQAISFYNSQHVWNLNDVQISVGTGTIAADAGTSTSSGGGFLPSLGGSTGGPVQQLSGLFSSASQLGIVLLLGVGVYFFLEMKRAVQ